MDKSAMIEKTYRLVFKGELTPGQSVERVQKNLAAILKLNQRQVERLFSGKPVVIKKGVNKETAAKFISTFHKAGARLEGEILPRQNEGPAPLSHPPPTLHTTRFSSFVTGMGRKKTDSKQSRDLLPVLVFIAMLCIFVGLSGYLVWRGFEIVPTIKEAVKPLLSSRADVKKKSARSSHKARSKKRAARTKEQMSAVNEINRLKKEGLNFTRKQQYARAEPRYRKRLDLIVQNYGKTHRSIPPAMNDLAFTLREQGRMQKAEALYLESIKILEETGRQDSLSVAVASEGLARIYVKQNRLDEIEPLYQRAIEIWDRLRGPDNANTLSIKYRRAVLLEKLGRKEEAKMLRNHVNEIYKRQLEARRAKARGSSSSSKAEKTAAVGSTRAGEGNLPRHVVKILVSISRDFAPVRMNLSSISGFHPRLSDLPPADLIKEPKYQGQNQRYGKLLLGTRENKTYYFALDLIKDGHLVLYFDRNQNRDLGDDGPPLVNRSKSLFATTISIPMHRLIKELDRSENFKIWFYTNKDLWPKGIFTHYSLTQMKGHVTIDGRPYLAYIAERGANNADFTDDGLFIDLNGNGKIECDAEYIKPGEVAVIGDKAYWFDIDW